MEVAKVTNEKNQDILRAIINLTAENGYPPTIREVVGETGYSWGSIVYRLQQMRDRGLVEWVRSAKRTLQVTEAGRELVHRGETQEPAGHSVS